MLAWPGTHSEQKKGEDCWLDPESHPLLNCGGDGSMYLRPPSTGHAIVARCCMDLYGTDRRKKPSAVEALLSVAASRYMIFLEKPFYFS